MKESHVVARIERELRSAERFHVNLHGSTFSKNGVADFLTHDVDGVFTAIEAKAPGAEPYVNQWRRAIEVLRSGGRFIVAYGDFSVEALDSHSLRTETIGDVVGESEFNARLENRVESVEIELSRDN